MIKKIINVIIMIITFIGCNNMIENDNKEVYLYETKEYNKLVVNSQISLEQAFEIVCGSKLFKPFFQHYLIYGGDYVFTQIPPSHASILVVENGVKVNMSSGEIDLINANTYKDSKVLVNKSIALKCEK